MHNEQNLLNLYELNIHRYRKEKRVVKNLFGDVILKCELCREDVTTRKLNNFNSTH